MIKKIFRLSVFLLFTVVLLAVTVRIIIVMPGVQTWLVEKVTNYLSKELKTRVEVKHVDIAFFRTIVLRDIYIEDLQKDTLLYSRELNVNISRFNYQDKSIVIKSMELNDARVAIRKYKNTKGLNFHF